MKLVYCLTRKTLKYKNLIQKVCMFLQKQTLHCRSSLAFGPQGPKLYRFGRHFYSKDTRKIRFHVFLQFHVRKHMITSFYLKWTKFRRNYDSHLTCKVAHKYLNVREWVEVVEKN